MSGFWDRSWAAVAADPRSQQKGLSADAPQQAMAPSFSPAGRIRSAHSHIDPSSSSARMTFSGGTILSAGNVAAEAVIEPSGEASPIQRRCDA